MKTIKLFIFLALCLYQCDSLLPQPHFIDYSQWRFIQITSSDDAANKLVVDSVQKKEGIKILAKRRDTNGYRVVDLAVSPNISNIDDELSYKLHIKTLPEYPEYHRDLTKRQLGVSSFNNFFSNLVVFKNIFEPKFSSIVNTPIKSGREKLDFKDFYRYDSYYKFALSLARKNENVRTIKIGYTEEGRPMFAVIMSKETKKIERTFRKFRKAKIDLKDDLKTQSKKRKRRTEIILPNYSHKNQFKYYLIDKIKKKKKDKNNRRKCKKKKKNRKTDPKLPIIVIEAGIHAREWISSAVAAYIADDIAKNQDILSMVSFVIVINANPDGLEHSHLVDRLWRKNRRKNFDSDCMGVDLNRNWDIDWGRGVYDECGDEYHGGDVFSEPEVQSIGGLVMALRQKIVSYISLHNYSQYVMYPWSYSLDPPKRKPILEKYSQYLARLLKKFSNCRFDYVAGQASTTIYVAQGTSLDWVASKGITHSYTIELPDHGRLGFLTPPEDIIPIGNSTWLGLKCLTQKILKIKKIDRVCS